MNECGRVRLQNKTNDKDGQRDGDKAGAGEKLKDPKGERVVTAFLSMAPSPAPTCLSQEEG